MVTNYAFFQLNQGEIHLKSNKSTSLPVLGTRQLNRALLARQMLLQRGNLSVLDAIEWLIGLQAQAPNPPYYALWTRLEGFDHERLAELIQSKQAVRIALMRSTIHLVSARDSLQLRPWIQPVLDRSLYGSFGKRLAGSDPLALAAAGREIIESDGPLTISDLGKRLNERWPDYDQEALGAAIRNSVPLVQVPPRGLWGVSGQAVHTTIEAWLDQPLSSTVDTAPFLLRYLQAYGPATVKDFQAWSGLTKVRDTFDMLRTKLVMFQNEQGEELFDLPDAPRPEPDLQVTSRLLGEFDHILLSHADRARIIDETYRRRIITNNGLVKASILVDGFVAGFWSIARQANKAVLNIQPFHVLTVAQKDELMKEGERLLRFAAADVEDYDIDFASNKIE